MIEQAGGSVTITGKPMLTATYRSVLLGIRARRSDGLPWTDLQELALTLRRALVSSERQEVAGPWPRRHAGMTSQRATTGAPQARQLSSWVCPAAASSGWHATQVVSKPFESAGRGWCADRRRCWCKRKGVHDDDRTDGVPIELAAVRRTTA